MCRAAGAGLPGLQVTTVTEAPTRGCVHLGNKHTCHQGTGTDGPEQQGKEDIVDVVDVVVVVAISIATTEGYSISTMLAKTSSKQS